MDGIKRFYCHKDGNEEWKSGDPWGGMELAERSWRGQTMRGSDESRISWQAGE